MSLTIWNDKAITAGATNTLGQLRLGGLHIHKTLVGTIVIKNGTTTVATYAIGTLANSYRVVPGGSAYSNLIIESSSASDDVSISAVSA